MNTGLFGCIQGFGWFLLFSSSSLQYQTFLQPCKLDNVVIILILRNMKLTYQASSAFFLQLWHEQVPPIHLPQQDYPHDSGISSADSWLEVPRQLNQYSPWDPPQLLEECEL